MTGRGSVRVTSMVWLSFAVLTVLSAAAFLRNAGGAITQISLGIVLALALDPLVVAVSRKIGMSRPYAVTIVATTIVIATVLVLAFVGPSAAREAAKFKRQLPATIRDFEHLPLIGHSIRSFDVQQHVDDWLRELPNRVDAAAVQGAAARVLTDTFSILVVMCTTLGALIDGPRIIRLFQSLARRDPAMLRRINRAGSILSVTLGQYFGGSLTVAGLSGVVILSLGLILQVPLAPIAALWAMITDLVPQIGGFLGGSFFVLLALTKGPVAAIIAAALFIAYLTVKNHVISPAIIGDSVGLTPATTMIAVLIGGAIAGLPGTIVATPLIGSLKRLYFETRTGSAYVSKKRPTLKERLRHWGARIRPKR